MGTSATPHLVAGSGPGGIVGDDGSDTWNISVSVRVYEQQPRVNASITVELLETGQQWNFTSVPDGNGFMRVELPGVTGVQAWWPNGYGAQALYTLRTTLFGPPLAGVPQTQIVNTSFGFRTVELVQDPLPGGTSFEFHVNGVRDPVLPLPLRLLGLTP